MLLPTPRAAALAIPGLVLAVAAPGAPWLVPAVLALDAALLGVVLLDAWRAPGPTGLRVARRLREPLSAFARNPVEVDVASVASGTLHLAIADAPPASFDSEGHRWRGTLPPGGRIALAYEVRPRERGSSTFGDLHVRAAGPLGLGARRFTVPLAREVPVWPDLAAAATIPAGTVAGGGRVRRRGHAEGREFASLRPYLPGDDVRSIDWKATARRGGPVVREWQPERNQALWILLDCGRPLAGRLDDGRTRLDHAVDAALALARAAAARGDRTGAILFGAAVERVVPPGAGRAPLAGLAEGLAAATSRLEEPDYGAALDAFAARQRRRALVVLLTDVADPDAAAALAERAGRLAHRHLVLVAAIGDPAVAGAAAARPGDEPGAYLRAAAERRLAERAVSLARLAAAQVKVEDAPAHGLAAAVVRRYHLVKSRGEL